MKTNKLRKLRLLKGLSQECIASDLGISQKAYSDIENGKVSVNNEKLQKIAEILKIAPSELCGLAGKCDLDNGTYNKIKEYLNAKNIEIPNFLRKL